ncbi:ATP-binding protein [Saccharibacillus sp. CPCC 101409]|uniref:ATP-binding protein n=1 Tax=Saccharibacillus sp. CPCC 101409 TaxID=3058041 RepID=UPI0026722519|nr:ATP-binding protein [Saccharibacillus sp. CPCC 101409]MDO3411378.1 ATP-binding protein [Saccharibacillus sp. CPCC 101409]
MNGVKSGLARRIAYGTLALFVVLGALLAAAELAVHRQYTDISDELEERIERLNLIRDTERSFLESVSYLRAYAAYGRGDLESEALAAQREYERLSARMGAIWNPGEPEWGAGSNFAAEGEQVTDDLNAGADSLNARYAQYFQRTMDLIGTGDTEASAELSAAAGTPLIRKMEAEFAGRIERERDRVQVLGADSRLVSRSVLLVPIFGMAAALIAAAVLIRYLRRAFVLPVLRAEAAIGRIEQGEDAQLGLDAESAPDEIGSLLGGIGRMAEGIRSRQRELEENLRLGEEQQEELEAQNEELEAQNEQILDQRREMERMLDRLTRREAQLEAINSYQRSLVGLTDLGEFLREAIGQLIVVTGRDAAMLVMRRDAVPAEAGAEEADGAAREPSGNRPDKAPAASAAPDRFDMLYSSGYPDSADVRGFDAAEPAGAARQAMEANRLLVRRRPVSGAERGAHGAYETAVDAYYPVYDGSDPGRPAGFLLLTGYGDLPAEAGEAELTEGLVRQFIGALFAQLTQAERQRQSRELERKSAELEQEKRNLREQRDSTQQVIDSIHEALVVCAPDGEILLCNRITAELLDPVFRPGRNFADAMDALNESLGMETGAGERIRNALSLGLSETRARYAFEPPDRPARHFEVYVQRIDDAFWGDVRLFVFRDRTEEEETSRMRDEFVSMVSHELRTPLSSILGFAEIMLNRTVKPDKARRYVETIHGEAVRLSGLIGDFLDLQRIEAGKQNYRLLPLDLKPLAEDIAAQWDGREGHRIRLNLPDGVCAVRSDGDRLRQILHNLLSNAVKYSPGQERIDLDIRGEGGRWIVEVRDYGLGIPEEAKPHLFGKFYRVDNSDRRQIGGTGLGLAIVKEMVEGLGGTIAFESEFGSGSAFRFELPVLELPDTAGAVVVLEDDESLGRLIEEAFSESWGADGQGVPVLRFAEAEEALLALEQSAGGRAPGLCIVDLELAGELDGWAFIRRLGGEEGARQAPVVISSALDPPDGYAESEREKYLRKPFTVRELLELGRRLTSAPGGEAGPDAPGPGEIKLALPAPSEPLARASLEEHGLEVRRVEVKGDFAIAEIGTEDEGGSP